MTNLGGVLYSRTQFVSQAGKQYSTVQAGDTGEIARNATGTQELFEPSALASPVSVIDRAIDHRFCSFRCEIRVNRRNCTKYAKGSKTFRLILIYTGSFFSRERLVYINAISMNKFLQNSSSAIHENIGIKKSFRRTKHGRKISKYTFLFKLPNTPSVKNTHWEYLIGAA